MTRRELVRLFVLNSLCDDYENLDQVILRDVKSNFSLCGLSIERPEVVAVLGGLVENGLVKAYELGDQSTELSGMPNVDIVCEHGFYFYITKTGMELKHHLDERWPFDDDDNLLPGFHLYDD